MFRSYNCKYNTYYIQHAFLLDKFVQLPMNKISGAMMWRSSGLIAVYTDLPEVEILDANIVTHWENPLPAIEYVELQINLEDISQKGRQTPENRQMRLDNRKRLAVEMKKALDVGMEVKEFARLQGIHRVTASNIKTKLLDKNPETSYK